MKKYIKPLLDDEKIEINSIMDDGTSGFGGIDENNAQGKGTIEDLFGELFK